MNVIRTSLIAAVLLSGNMILADASRPAENGNAQRGGNFCQSPTVCIFDGLINTALGQAQLSINAMQELVVSNVGESGADGVEITRPGDVDRSPGDNRTAHEPWINLGLIERRPIDISTTGQGAYFDTTSRATLTSNTAPFFASGVVTLHSEQISATQVEITPDLRATLPTDLMYEVYNGGALVGSCNSNAVIGSAIVADAWPTLESFVEVRWAAPATVSITGGTGCPSGVQADEIHIHPENAQRALLGVGKVTHLSKGIPALRAAETFVIVREEIGAPFFSAAAIPTMPEWAMIALAMLVLAFGAWHARRLF